MKTETRNRVTSKSLLRNTISYFLLLHAGTSSKEHHSSERKQLFIHRGTLQPSMRAAPCVLFLMRCDWLECVHNCLCLRTGGLGYSLGLFVCWMGRCQLQSRGHSKKSCTQLADVICSGSVFCCYRSDVLILIL